MKFVEPIRDMKKISRIKNQLTWAWKIRDLVLFWLGINSALRISDLLSVKVWDVFDADCTVKEYFEMNEAKTNKKHRVTITKSVKNSLLLYKEKYQRICTDPNNFLFFNTKKDPLWKTAILRQHARYLINEWCKGVWLKWSYWWHTLRKTRWYQARKQGIPMEIIQHKLNHSSMSVTKRYLGITDDEIMEACHMMDL